MVKILVVMALIVIVAGLVALVLASDRRRRISNAARYAPQALDTYGVPQPVIDLIIMQGRQLEQGRDIMRGMLGDPVLTMGLPTTHATKMEEWLKATGPKEID